jgi:hypothetical protein
MLQEKLEEPISEPPSPRQFTESGDTVGGIATHITSLREEIRRLRLQLAKSEADCKFLHRDIITQVNMINILLTSLARSVP